MTKAILLKPEVERFIAQVKWLAQLPGLRPTARSLHSPLERAEGRIFATVPPVRGRGVRLHQIDTSLATRGFFSAEKGT